MSDTSRSPESGDNALPLAKRLPPDILLIIFIHGFKGTDETFVGFPQRLQHVLSETIDNVVVECIVFPAYETRGELNEAVERFADWLTNLTVKKEVANGEGGGAGKAKVVLCGHSMGGLLAADTLLEFANSRHDKSNPLWPRIIACIAFDTPYYGLHPYVFKNTISTAVDYAGAAKSVFNAFSGVGGSKAAAQSSSKPLAAITDAAAAGSASTGMGWGKWAAVGGVLAATAAAGTAAYYKRDDLKAGYDIGSQHLNVGYSWATDHINYVKTLWNEDALKKRVNDVIELEKTDGVIFRTFYTNIPASPPSHVFPRTFVVLPPANTPPRAHFHAAHNKRAPDELRAHTGMFGANTNDGYYELGLATARVVRDAVALQRGHIADGESSATRAAAKEAMSDELGASEQTRKEDVEKMTGPVEKDPWAHSEGEVSSGHERRASLDERLARAASGVKREESPSQ